MLFPRRRRTLGDRAEDSLAGGHGRLRLLIDINPPTVSPSLPNMSLYETSRQLHDAYPGLRLSRCALIPASRFGNAAARQLTGSNPGDV
jgi:hypothetical protein